jgi:hypothetical protein
MNISPKKTLIELNLNTIKLNNFFFFYRTRGNQKKVTLIL